MMRILARLAPLPLLSYGLVLLMHSVFADVAGTDVSMVLASIVLLVTAFGVCCATYAAYWSVLERYLSWLIK